VGKGDFPGQASGRNTTFSAVRSCGRDRSPRRHSGEDIFSKLRRANYPKLLAPHLGSLQLRLSLAECFRLGLDGTALLKKKKE